MPAIDGLFVRKADNDDVGVWMLTCQDCNPFSSKNKIGAPWLQSSWKNFAVMTRPGYDNQGLETILGPEFASRFAYDESARGFRGPTGHLIYFREVTFLDIASSNIRKRAKEEKDIRYLVTDEIRHYIVKNGLYRGT